MQIANRLTAATAGDGLGNLAGRSASQVATGNKDENGAQAGQTGFFDPTPRISLSADALLYLSRTKKSPERLPPLTRDEWNNNSSPQLASREYQAFGRFAETGDYKAYYGAFIDYYDSLRPEDQNSLRYFGTREAAVAGLRSLEYDAESGLDVEANFQALVSVFLDEDKAVHTDVPPSALRTEGGGFDWNKSNISYEDQPPEPRSVSEIERLYSELF
ncbi:MULTISPECIES: biotin biosynthesis protein BioC [unclassified Sinorhizobium]|uniref:biotin biosynthesis protein BioC n=1 Tax=unclassified Sinorhizobium TaxID=2613772 RepID=UPI0024C2EE88|nr:MULTISPECIES: biotin biosynthesis protein BioC [unclassified Sinorhizobium]MDK1376614.1 biotin biosynthesis protein BioC [Sinorhizobium sp. 6-70]MDK1477108.1 biotin biosynthesis protein BioC [Sinorhizobium sp. 6-117]MDK1477223.1 biotin biosynthesis protein BioC [Sinorhizobium sp. 6-117]